MSLIQTPFKYNYVIKNPWNIRLANLFALISFIFVIYGFSEFLKINIWYAIIFGPIIFLISYNKISYYFTNLFYPEFNTNEHEKFVENYWKNTTVQPSVDVFLPVAGEDIETIRKTWVGVRAINYSNVNVYVLDDSNTPQLAEMARRFGFNYLTRPNRGEYKKSGNIQYGLDNSSSQYVFILDADFISIPEALIETIPYIDQSPKTSILQTPQYFDVTEEIHEKSNIQYGAATSVEDFYRLILPSESALGSGKCVGTSAIYRREAILNSGGMPKVNGSEDIVIGLSTIKNGYRVDYIPLIVSKGVCPSDVQSYFKQQSRWADGTVTSFWSNLVFNKELNLWTKFSYFGSFLYYLIEAITPILSLQILALLYFNTDSIKLSWIIPFIPYLFYQFVIAPRIKIAKTKFGTKLAGFINTLAYIDAIARIMFKKVQKWEATGSKTIKKTINSEFYLAVSMFSIFNAIFILLFAFVLLSRPYVIYNWETWILLIVGFKRVWEFLVYNFILGSFVLKGVYKDFKIRRTSTVSVVSIIVLFALVGISVTVGLGGTIGSSIYQKMASSSIEGFSLTQ